MNLNISDEYAVVLDEALKIAAERFQRETQYLGMLSGEYLSSDKELSKKLEALCLAFVKKAKVCDEIRQALKKD